MICLSALGRVKFLFGKMESVSSSTSGKKKNKDLCYQRRIPVGFLRDENGKYLLTYVVGL